MRARGLKRKNRKHGQFAPWSRPMRARGLKQEEIQGMADAAGRAPCGRVG